MAVLRWVVARTDNTRPAWSVRLIDELDAMDRRATAVAEGLSQEQLNWKAEPNTWSVGQCLQHLYVANDVYLPHRQAPNFPA